MNKGRPPSSAIQMAPIGTGVTLGVEAKTYCELDRVSATGPSHATDNSRRKLASAEFFPKTAPERNAIVLVAKEPIPRHGEQRAS